ncbi:MAG: hypothetical protein PHD67_03605 [Oscillospiraceae bacterium]|nr:hypothetical protein [Oscillospiraceae bacterium]
MNRKTKLILKIGAALVAFVLIGLVFTVTNAMVGNPLSKALATHDIRNYISRTYNDPNLTVDAAVYSFKFGEYFSHVHSSVSADTTFAVHWSGGKIIRDDYESNVTNRWNTYIRLDQVYGDAVEAKLTAGLPWDYDMVLAGLDKNGNEDFSRLELDMEADPFHPPLSTYVTVYLYTDDLSWENLADTALQLDRFLSQNGFYPDWYDVVLEPTAKKDDRSLDSIGVYDFPREKLSLPDLAGVMEAHYADWERSWDEVKEEKEKG